MLVYIINDYESTKSTTDLTKLLRLLEHDVDVNNSGFDGIEKADVVVNLCAWQNSTAAAYLGYALGLKKLVLCGVDTSLFSPDLSNVTKLDGVIGVFHHIAKMET